MKRVLLFVIGSSLTLSSFAQANSQAAKAGELSRSALAFRMSVISRTADAVNYQHRGGATQIDFTGTALMPSASGGAKVESKKGYMEIEVEFSDPQKPTKLGSNISPTSCGRFFLRAGQ